MILPNAAPILSELSNITIKDNELLGDIAFTLHDESPLACNSVVVNSSNEALVSNQSIVVSGTAPLCTLKITPQANTLGSSTIRLTASDGSLSSTRSFILTIISSDTPPVANNITPPSFSEDLESSISLSYTDEQGDKATSCAIYNLSHITISTPCSCDSSGVCTVGVKGSLNYYGAGSFNYTVIARNKTSNLALANLNISSVDDPPVSSSLSPSPFNEDTIGTVSSIWVSEMRRVVMSIWPWALPVSSIASLAFPKRLERICSIWEGRPRILSLGA